MNGPLNDVGPPRSLHLDCAAVMFFVIHHDLDILECTFSYLFLETSFQVDAFCLELRWFNHDFWTEMILHHILKISTSSSNSIDSLFWISYHDDSWSIIDKISWWLAEDNIQPLPGGTCFTSLRGRKFHSSLDEFLSSQFFVFSIHAYQGSILV